MAKPIDLTSLTYEEVVQLKEDTIQEIIRRDDEERLPLEIDTLTQRFVDSGGDTAKLKDPKGYKKGPRTLNK